MFGTQSLWISELAELEKTGQSKLLLNYCAVPFANAERII